MARKVTIDWDRPVLLSSVRKHFETLQGSDFEPSFVPGNLVMIGFITGYRVLTQTSDFRELQLSVSQGQNEELRLNYVGKPFYFHEFSRILRKI